MGGRHVKQYLEVEPFPGFSWTLYDEKTLPKSGTFGGYNLKEPVSLRLSLMDLPFLVPCPVLHKHDLAAEPTS